MESDFLMLLVLCAALGGTVGYFIGKSKGRESDGLGLGIALGPIGWLITAALKDMRPKCGACLGPVPAGASRCMHCGERIEQRAEQPAKAAEDWNLM